MCVFTRFEQLTDLLKPSQLEITNDSWQHRHHRSMRAEGGGNGETRTYFLCYASHVIPLPWRAVLTMPFGAGSTDFTINIVSEVFQGKVCTLFELH